MKVNRSVSKKVRAAKAKQKSVFEQNVFVSAKFERRGTKLPEGADDEDYTLKSLYINDNGHLIGRARCGSTAFVRTQQELPELVKFLSQLNDPIVMAHA